MTNSVTLANTYCNSQKIDTLTPVRTVTHQDYIEQVYKTSPSKGRKFGVGLASFLFTGLGQFINGEWLKGICMLLGSSALRLLGHSFSIKALNSMDKISGKNKILSLIIDLGVFSLKVFSITDAVKHAKSETVQIIPNQNNKDSHEMDYPA